MSHSTGNWKGFREDDTGSGTWSLIQSRSANMVNEITGITNSVGPSWTDPAYDANGNMTTVPQPSAPSSAYAATYDAWNRAVKFVDPSTGNNVQANAYDGRNYRTIRNSFTAGVLSETRDYFYTSAWQSIEEWVGESSNPERQFVWGLRSSDDLVLRDRDTTGGGTINERLYALQDPLGSVVALANPFGVVQERYAYSPYGEPVFLSSTFAEQIATLFDWETLFASYRADLAISIYLARRRRLNCATGCWLTCDPLGAATGPNPYEYAISNPVLHIDPTGEIIPVIVGGGILIIILLFPTPANPPVPPRPPGPPRPPAPRPPVPRRCPIPAPGPGCEGTCLQINNSQVVNCRIQAAAGSPECGGLLNAALTALPGRVCTELTRMIAGPNPFNSNSCSDGCICQIVEQFDGQLIQIPFNNTTITAPPENFQQGMGVNPGVPNHAYGRGNYPSWNRLDWGVQLGPRSSASDRPKSTTSHNNRPQCQHATKEQKCRGYICPVISMLRWRLLPQQFSGARLGLFICG